MDYDPGARDLGLGSALDALLDEASLAPGAARAAPAHPDDGVLRASWEGDSRSTCAASVVTAQQPVRGSPPASPRVLAVSPESPEAPSRTLFVEEDDEESDDGAEEFPPRDEGRLRAWARDACRRLRDAKLRSEADRLALLALSADGRTTLGEDLELQDSLRDELQVKEARWLLERTTLETVGRARDREHAERLEAVLSEAAEARLAAEKSAAAEREASSDALTTSRAETADALSAVASLEAALANAADEAAALRSDLAAAERRESVLTTKLAHRRKDDARDRSGAVGVDLDAAVSDEDDVAAAVLAFAGGSPRPSESTASSPRPFRGLRELVPRSASSSPRASADDDVFARYLEADDAREAAAAASSVASTLRTDAGRKESRDRKRRLAAAEDALRSLSEARTREATLARSEHQRLVLELEKIEQKHAAEKSALGAHVARVEREEIESLRRVSDDAKRDASAKGAALVLLEETSSLRIAGLSSALSEERDEMETLRRETDAALATAANARADLASALRRLEQADAREAAAVVALALLVSARLEDDDARRSADQASRAEARLAAAARDDLQIGRAHV